MVDSTVKRGLGGSPITAPRYTEREEDVLNVLALIFASVSIVSTTLTVYWFMIMRRSFRHQSVSVAWVNPSS
jgi:G protein-coupled glucose receptor regulating Gpa2